MKVANPIYDVVFKYLLTNNNKIAILIISNLINKNIIELKVNPTEIIASKKKKKPLIGSKESYTVMRLDFAAKIKNDDGTEELILIEMQKAKLITDIMRFRKYLGSQYMNETHKYKLNGTEVAMPIFPIYILGHKLDDFDEEAITIKRSLFNALTDKPIKKHSHFIDGLSHDGLVIQIPCVSNQIKKNKTKPIHKYLGELLTIFDQSNHYEDNKHFLEIEKDNIPGWLVPILRELEKAGKDEEVKNRMQLEDDYIADLEDLERQIEDKDKVLEDNKKVLEDNKKVLEDNKKALEDKDKIIIELTKQLGE